jgi:acetoin utilization protein AcuB
MFVSRSMTAKVITVDKSASIFEAQEKLVRHRIRHLPVVDADNRLIGIITDRDIRSALPFSLFKDPTLTEEREKIGQLTIGDIMSADVKTIRPEHTIQDALLLIQELRVGALPVVDKDNKLKGIISVRDLLRAFINVLGFGQPGTLLGILVEEQIGQLKKIVDAITEEQVSFGSVLVARSWEKNKRAVFPYLLTQNVAHIKKKLQKMGYTLLDPLDWYLDQLPEKKE